MYNIVSTNKSNVITLNTNFYDEELADIHEHLHKFILSECKDLFSDEVYHHFPTISEKSTALFDDYFMGIGVWSITNADVNADTEESIFDYFIHKYKWRIKHDRISRTLALWKTTFPTGYIVQAVDTIDQFITISDVLTEEKFHLPMHQATYTVGELLIGSLIPYVSHHEFLIEAIHLKNIAAKRFIQLLEQYNPLQIGPGHFPYFLKHVLEIEYESTDYFNDDYEIISQLIIMEMHANDHELWMITLAASTWDLFCKTYRPVIKGMDAYVAAIEYFTLHEYSDERLSSLHDFAMLYHVSPKQLAEHYEKIQALYQHVDSPATEPEVFHGLYVIDSKK